MWVFPRVDVILVDMTDGGRDSEVGGHQVVPGPKDKGSGEWLSPDTREVVCAEDRRVVKETIAFYGDKLGLSDPRLWGGKAYPSVRFSSGQITVATSEKHAAMLDTRSWNTRQLEEKIDEGHLLSDEEMDQVVEGEEGIFKVQMRVPIERRAEVLKGLVRDICFKAARMQGADILRHARESGNDKIISQLGSDLIDKLTGGLPEEGAWGTVLRLPATYFKTMIIPHSFVFYCSSEAHMRQVAEYLLGKAKRMKLPNIEHVPDFFQAAERDRNLVYSSQGDRQTKEYVRDHGDLDRYYDSKTGYAFYRLENNTSAVNRKRLGDG